MRKYIIGGCAIAIGPKAVIFCLFVCAFALISETGEQI